MDRKKSKRGLIKVREDAAIVLVLNSYAKFRLSKFQIPNSKFRTPDSRLQNPPPFLQQFRLTAQAAIEAPWGGILLVDPHDYEGLCRKIFRQFTYNIRESKGELTWAQT
jgi:hypothetical protein